ncbi:S9 family peptidase [Danxiaibacter flavus]|uniref:S9 family peptidase n=1 Tax=Danxiaibacter flavus TaxID=3049108 RepID=A0ABV3ZP36_9BACT|nr:S9 family peptidase [Chitinophagaceae bacterium DXS]
MRKTLVKAAGLSVFALMVLNGSAQLKQLTGEQIFQNKTTGLLKDLPVIAGWKDDTHYIISAGKDGHKSVDVISGKEESIILPVKSDNVYLEKNDIFFKDAGGKAIQLTKTPDEEKNPTLSPDATRIAFTRNNNLFVLEIASGKETQLSTDGSDVVYNGYASWVYYEEILGRPSKYKAFWWSPDSKHLAYMHFNDSKVPMFPLYGADGQHGYVEETRYPAAGDPNPEVKIGIADITTAQTVWSDFNEKDDQYFGTPFWSPDGKKLWQQWMNRGQDHLFVYAIDPTNGSKTAVYEEQQKTWIDWLDDIHFLANNKGYIVVSDKSGWMHIYQYDMNGKPVKQITDGNWTVKDIVKIDEKKQQVYFTARKENSARFDYYVVGLDGKNLKRLTFGDYTHSVEVSPNATYFITTYSNLNTPKKMAVVDNKGKLIREIADSKGDDYDKYQTAKTELIRVNVDGFDLPVTIIYPNNFDEHKKYPVFISIYGGPNAGTVYDSYKGIGEYQWWAKEDLIQVAIDHRGSGHFGKAGQNYLHRDLSHWEIHDYSEVVKWLSAKPYINKDKVAISGFSYGGYTTCMALTRGADVFKYGIAGGSVTDWHLYDSHYTERYMDTPAENPEGYKSSAVATYLNNYKGNLYIIHGTMDDNVHMQNSIQLIGALQDKKADFQMAFYPGGRHGWRNYPDRWKHYNNERVKYIYKNLLEKEVPQEAMQ